jgi:hypothetical protein
MIAAGEGRCHRADTPRAGGGTHSAAQRAHRRAPRAARRHEFAPRAADARIARHLAGASLERRTGPYGAVAQLGERRVRNAKVEGSIPFRSTILVIFLATLAQASATMTPATVY